MLSTPLLLWFALFAFAASYSVNVPFWDSWEYTEVITGSRPLSLGYLWAQHNEHRMVWEKLFYVVFAKLTNWNEYWMALVPSILIGAGVILLICTVVKERPGVSLAGQALIAGCMAGWLLSVRQYENLYWSAGFTPALAFLLCIVFWKSFNRYTSESVGVGSLMLIIAAATVSYSGGIAIGVFVIAFGVVSSVVKIRLPTSYPILGIWSACLLGLYFWDLQVGIGLVDVLGHPASEISYALVYLGSPFAADVGLAVGFGLVLITGFAVGLVITIGRVGVRDALRELGTRYSLLPLELIVMAIVVAARSSMGLDQALAARYVSMSGLLAVSVVLYCVDRVWLWRRSAFLMFMLVVVIVSAVAWLDGMAVGVFSGQVHRDRLVAYPECVLNSTRLAERCNGSGVYPDAELLAVRVKALRSAHLSLFSGRSGGRSCWLPAAGRSPTSARSTLVWPSLW